MTYVIRMDWFSRSAQLKVTRYFCLILHMHTHHTLEHVSVGIVRDGKDVRRHLCSSPPPVHVDHLVCVDGQHAIGVDCHTKQA